MEETAPKTYTFLLITSLGNNFPIPTAAIACPNTDAILQDDDFDDDYEAHMDDELDDIVYQDYYYMDDDDEY